MFYFPPTDELMSTLEALPGYPTLHALAACFGIRDSAELRSFEQNAAPVLRRAGYAPRKRKVRGTVLTLWCRTEAEA